LTPLRPLDGAGTGAWPDIRTTRFTRSAAIWLTLASHGCCGRPRCDADAGLRARRPGRVRGVVRKTPRHAVPIPAAQPARPAPYRRVVPGNLEPGDQRPRALPAAGEVQHLAAADRAQSD